MSAERMRSSRRMSAARRRQHHSTPANRTTRRVQSTVPGAPRWPQGASVIGGIDGDGITSGEGGAASPWLHYNATAETGGGRVAVGEEQVGAGATALPRNPKGVAIEIV